MSHFEKRLIGTYLILWIGSWIVTLGMDGNGAARASPILFNFVSGLAWIMTMPPIVTGVGYVGLKIHEAIQRESDNRYHRSEIKPAELQRRRAESDAREAERLKERIALEKAEQERLIQARKKARKRNNAELLRNKIGQQARRPTPLLMTFDFERGHMVLTERDRKLLSIVQSYGCLKTKQINHKVFPGVATTTVLRRLRILKNDGLVQQIRGLETSECLWSVTPKSLEKYLEGGGKVHFPRAILEHDSMLTDLRIKLEEAGVAGSWRPEHVIRKQVAEKHGIKELGRKVIPDGILGIEINGVNESVAIELELSVKNQSRYRQILTDYFSKRNLWGVWYLVPSNSILRQIIKARKSIYRSSTGPRLMFSLVDEVMRDPLSAQVLCEGTTLKLTELFARKLQMLPAHTGAHEVSGRAEEIKAEEVETSA